MSVPATQSRQVAESSFEFLHIEMVDYVKRQCTLAWTENKENKASDVKLLQAYELLCHGCCTHTPCRKISNKLENLGFGVGERLVERCAFPP
jgi:hypothetical protein